jgi:hypothetical protein
VRIVDERLRAVKAGDSARARMVGLAGTAEGVGGATPWGDANFARVGGTDTTPKFSIGAWGKRNGPCFSAIERRSRAKCASAARVVEAEVGVVTRSRKSVVTGLATRTGELASPRGESTSGSERSSARGREDDRSREGVAVRLRVRPERDGVAARDGTRGVCGVVSVPARRRASSFGSPIARGVRVNATAVSAVNDVKVAVAPGGIRSVFALWWATPCA